MATDVVAPKPRRRTPEYQAWADMKCRCNNPKHDRYQYYGGRGIRVCQRWLASFWAFLRDMGPRPSSGHTLERIDNDGDYRPGNCKWATWLEQAQNTRQTRLLRLNGSALSVSAWARKLGLSTRALRDRLEHMPVEKALLTPRQPSGGGGRIT